MSVLLIKNFSFRFFVLFFMASFCISGCTAKTKNPLFGDWILDKEKTLFELRKKPYINKYEKILKCYEVDACGSYVASYRDGKYFYLYPLNDLGDYIATGPVKYSVEVKGATINLITVHKNGDIGSRPITLTNGGYTVDLNGYQEFFVKTEIPNGKITYMVSAKPTTPESMGSEQNQ